MLYALAQSYSVFVVLPMLESVFGYVVFLVAAFCFCGSKNLRTGGNWKPIVYGILFQIAVVFAITNIPVIVTAFESVANGIMKLKEATMVGTKFVFGYIGGDTAPFEVTNQKGMFNIAFQALPVVIMVATLSAILTYLKVIPYLAKIMGYLFKVIFRVNESIGMVSASKIFLGQLEAPLLIKSRLASLSKSDIFIILTLAFATSSASMTPVYASAIQGICPDAMKHMVMSSVINVISVLIMSAIVMPVGGSEMKIADQAEIQETKAYPNFMAAMSKGLSDGINIWWCIVGSLIGMIALVTFINYLFALFPDFAGTPITLQRICGIIMYPFAWIMGIESKDLMPISQILGTKIVLNEAIAFFDLAKANVSYQSVVRTIYVINNFGNLACIGITVAGMLALSPSQKCITALAGKAFFTAILATGLTATLMNVVFSF